MRLAAPTTADEGSGHHRGLRPRLVFASRRGAARRRRASDAVLLASALGSLGLLAWASTTPSRLGDQLAALVAALPGWLDPVWLSLYDMLGLWAVLVIAAAVLARRPGVALAALGSGALALALGAACARLVEGSWPGVADAARAAAAEPRFPAIRLAAEAAAVLSVAPSLVRPIRVVGGWIVALGALSAFLLAVAAPSGVAAGLAVAVAAAAAVRLAGGTTAGTPDVQDFATALAELGVPAYEIEPAGVQRAGVSSARARDAAGRPLIVKVVGRDAYDNRVLQAAWRSVWYRGDAALGGLSRRQIVEHEALMTLLAGAAGVPTREVVTAGVTAGEDAVLVLRGGGRPLAELPAGELAGAQLGGAWRALARLHEAGIAHGQLSPESLVIDDDGGVGLADLGDAEVAPPADRLRSDDAQLLATTATAAGGERAVAAALSALGADGLTATLPFLQDAAFDRPLRHALHEAGLEVDALRAAAAAAAGAPPPELQRLRRVTWGTAFQAALLMLAAAALITAFTSLDYDTIAAELRDAEWAWLVAGFLTAQVPRLSQAVATLGSVPTTLPLGPVYAMQLATNYMNLALPSSVARLAVNIRFFQRQGISPATAVASGTIDAFAGNAIQVVLLVLLLLFSSADLQIGLHAPASGGPRRLLALLAALLAVSVLTVVVVRPLRTRLRAGVGRWWPDARDALRAVRTPRKLACLIGGDVVTELLFAGALGMFALALGYHISFANLLLINLSVSLFSSLIPIPGGIGVTEGGLMVGLSAAGVPQDAAFAIAICDRLATFYLPPLWGWYAMRWLQQHRYL